MSKVENGKGFVYILKDDHFKRGVKIGRAHNVAKRIRPMLTANPWLSVYIKVETSKAISLRAVKHCLRRVDEFWLMGKGTSISDMKKLDWLLWATREPEAQHGVCYQEQSLKSGFDC